MEDEYKKNPHECVKRYVDDSVKVFFGKFKYFEQGDAPEFQDQKIK